MNRNLPVEWDSIRADGVPDTAFADEAAIDFPAVAHLVERERDAFLGGSDAEETLRAEVRLSRRDALTGAVVTLRVPVRGTCARCGGRGETWTEPCAGCCGTGHVEASRTVRLSVPAGVANGARLRFRVSPAHAAPVRVDVHVTLAADRG